MYYEKKYKEALERAIFVKENTDSVGAKDVSDVIEYIFSELKESEDEKIRSAIIDYLKDHNLIEWAAWLEKQGEQIVWENVGPVTEDDKLHLIMNEQKPSWSKEDETALYDALWAMKQAAKIAKDENDMGNIWYAENWLKSLKEKIKGE